MPLLFLNDLSCGTECEPAHAERAMTQFAWAVAAVVRADRQGTKLISKETLLGVEIARGYPIAKWLGQPENKDLALRLKKMQSTSPFRTVYPEGEDFLDVEYRHRGQAAEGLGAAHLMGGLGVSLPVTSQWDASALELEREQLLEETDAAAGSEVSDVGIRHASCPAHVDEHLPWIGKRSATARRNGLDRVDTGERLWEARTALFPHLQFLPRVEQDLRELPEVWVVPVRERLAELDEAVAEWNPTTSPIAPQWRSYVRGEFEARRRLCWFTDIDGEQRLFDWHSDFLPKPGRLHFRLVHAESTLRVAYVGRKLGV